MNYLDNAYVNVTASCNIQCQHCFINAGKAQKDELLTSDLLGLFTNLADIGTNRLTLTGGEPLFHPDIEKIIVHVAALRKRGIRKTSLFTNGMLVDENMAELVARNIDSVNVSIDGLENAHDAIRGRGSFNQSISGLRFFVNAGANPTVHITITKHNVDSLVELVDYLRFQEGIKKFRIRNLWLLGRAEAKPELRVEQSKIMEKLKGVGIRTDHLSRKSIEYPSLGYSINVHPNGNVYPCHFLQTPDFLAGNILEGSIKDIYLSSSLFVSLRKLRIDCCQTIPNAQKYLSRCLGKDFTDYSHTQEVGQANDDMTC